MLNFQFSILVCLYSVAKCKEHSVTKVNGNPPQFEVNFMENYFFLSNQTEENEPKNKQKTKNQHPHPRKGKQNKKIY